MSDRDASPSAQGNQDDQPKSEHLNIKVTDNNNEVFFKIKRTTALSKLMNAFCDRQGKQLATVRFLFDGARVNPSDSPDSVCHGHFSFALKRVFGWVLEYTENSGLSALARERGGAGGGKAWRRCCFFLDVPFENIANESMTHSSRCKTATH